MSRCVHGEGRVPLCVCCCCAGAPSVGHPSGGGSISDALPKQPPVNEPGGLLHNPGGLLNMPGGLLYKPGGLLWVLLLSTKPAGRRGGV